MSITVCLLMLTSISTSITQNVGQSENVLLSGPSLTSSGSGGLADSPWPMFQQNVRHTGLSPYDTSSNPGKLKWSFTTGYQIYSSPAIGFDGTIYVGSEDYKIYAINPDGSEKWSFSTGNYVHSSPAIGFDGTIYVGSHDNKLYTINPDGSEKWQFYTGSWIVSSPAIGSDGTIYVGSNDYKLYAINPDGTEKWSFSTDGAISYSSPAIGFDGTIYVGSHDNKLYAINPDGTEKWNFATGDWVNTLPTIGSDGTIYIGSHDNKLYAINSDGSEKWNFVTGNKVHSSPAIGSDGTIYVGSYDKKLYAINPDGTEKWSYPTGNGVRSSPAIGSDGTIYVGSYDNKLYAINPDGSEKWTFTVGSLGPSSPAIDYEGTIYIGGFNDFTLYAIGNPNTNLEVQVTSHFTSLNSAAQSAITVHVTDGTNPVQGATVNLASDNGGIFSPQSGITDANGDFKSIFNAPTVTSQIICRISAEANKTGYNNGSGYVDVTLIPIPWPMFRHNLNHTGLSPYDTCSNNGKLKWSFTTGDWVWSSPTIGFDDTIYVGSWDKNLYAINPDGTEKWNFTTDAIIWSSSPTIGSEGTIYIGSDDNKLYAINPDGTEKWSFTTSDWVRSSPTIGSDGTIYIGSYDNNLYAINPDGSEKWRFNTGYNIQSSPAIGIDGIIYIGSQEGGLYALNPDGTEKWNFKIMYTVDSSPTIGSDGTIYIGSASENLYAINPDGTEKWTFMTSINSNIYSTPAIGSDETIYVGCDDRSLYAINPDGTQKWKFSTGNGILSSPAIGSDGTIYVGSYDNKLYAINPDGTEKWNFTTGYWVYSSPAIGSDGTIYIGSYDNKLYAIGGTAPNIIVEKTANVTVAKPGDLIEYTIYYNNTGPDEAGTVWINDTLPEGVTFITSSAEGNRTGDYNWTFYNVPAKKPTWYGPYVPSIRPGPGITRHHAMAYDSTNNRIVLFGGSGDSGFCNETWEYDTATHTWYGPFIPNPHPSATLWHDIAYDSANNKIVMYGGYDGTSGDSEETWEYDTATHTWSGPYMPSPRPGPGITRHHAMAYDSSNNRIVLIGGSGDSGFSNETWEYDTATHSWYGPFIPDPHPSATLWHNIAYDSANNKIVMYGGYNGTPGDSEETWEYDTATHTWSGPYMPSLRPGPRITRHHVMAYDSTNNRIVLFGGSGESGFCNETWEYDTASHTWFGPFIPDPHPSARLWHDIVYDSANNKIVMYGGYDGIPYDSEETWEYNHFHPNYFTITVQINSDVANGTILTNYVHLDYTDSSGNPMPYSSDTADVLVLAPENRPPVSNAGPDQTVNEGDIVQFNGSGSYDPDGGLGFGNSLILNDVLGSASSASQLIHPDIAIDKNDNIYVVWTDYRNNDPDIYFSKSEDGGESFSPNKRVNDDPSSPTKRAGQYYPSIAIDKEGDIYIVWSDERRGSFGDRDIYFTKSTDGGNTFQPNVRVDDTGNKRSDQWSAAIAVDDLKNIYVVWHEDRNIPLNRDIYFSKSTDGGVSWSSDVRVDDTGSDPTWQIAPEIEVHDGNIYVVWTERYMRGPYIDSNGYFTVSSDGGLTFNVSLKLNTLPNSNASMPDIEIGDDGTIYIVRSEWIGEEQSDILITTSKDKGHSFGNDIRVNDIVNGSQYFWWQSIAVDADNNIYVVWEEQESYTPPFNPPQTYYAKSSNLTNGFYPSCKVNYDNLIFTMESTIAVDSQGTPYVVWKGWDGYDWNVHFSKEEIIPSDPAIYEWDFDANDGLWWETGAVSDATGPTPTHIYGDDGVYVVTLRVTDNDNLSAIDTCNITVENVDPTVTIESITMEVEIGLRVAGRKYNNVSMALYQDGIQIGYVSIERLPGSPDEQMAWIPVSINFSSSYNATVTYTPEDPPNVGGNPVWIYLKSKNGSIKKIHHAFNVQQSKKRDSEHWNHVEPWEVDLNGYFFGLPFEIISHITDPGSDDEILAFTYGSQVKTVTYLNNPSNPDPYPSPEVSPVDILDTTTLVYEGPGIVTLVVKDDDNVRLGVGEGSDSKSVG